MSISPLPHAAREGFRPLTLRRLAAAGGQGRGFEVCSGSLSLWPTSRLPTLVDRALRRWPELAGQEAEWALRAGVPIVRAIVGVAEVLAGRQYGRWQVSERTGETGIFVITTPMAADRFDGALRDAIDGIEALLPLHLQGVAGLELSSSVLGTGAQTDDGPRQAAVVVLEAT